MIPNGTRNVYFSIGHLKEPKMDLTEPKVVLKGPKEMQKGPKRPKITNGA